MNFELGDVRISSFLHFWLGCHVCGLSLDDHDLDMEEGTSEGNVFMMVSESICWVFLNTS